MLEVGYSARDPDDLRAGLREPPVASMPVEYTTPAAEDRAVEVLTRATRANRVIALGGLSVIRLLAAA